MAERDDNNSESVFTMIGESFRGPLAWVCILAWVYGTVFAAGGVVAAVFFFCVDSLWARILCATCFLAAMLFVAAIKTFYWGLLFCQRIERKLGRLERKITQCCPPGQGG